MAYMYKCKLPAGSAPSSKLLDTFENEVLRQRSERKRADAARGIVDVTNLVHNQVEDGDMDDEDDVMAAYGGKRAAGQTPEDLRKSKYSTRDKAISSQHGDQKNSGGINEPSTPFSQRYRSRANAGTVVAKFNTEYGALDAWRTKGSGAATSGSTEPLITHLLEGSLTKPYRYMFESLQTKAGNLDETICHLSEAMMAKKELDEESEDAFTKHSTAAESQVAAGRICIDGSGEAGGRLNAASILLQGSMDAVNGLCLPLDVSRCAEYALFPGQIVVAEATNVGGNRLVASRLHCDASLGFPKNLDRISEPLTVIVASGPFSSGAEDLAFEPLTDLMKQVRKMRPRLVVLAGPFALPATEESFEDTFRRAASAISTVATELPSTSFILVASARDPHHHLVYPTPPYSLTLPEEVPANILLAPDPCMFSCEGIIFGATSTDILFHLGREEMAFPPRSGDRIKR